MSETPDTQATCWTLIHGAAAGDAHGRSEFARRYLPLVRGYLGAVDVRDPVDMLESGDL